MGTITMRRAAAREPTDLGRATLLLFVATFAFAIIVGVTGGRVADLTRFSRPGTGAGDLLASQIYRNSVHGIVKIIAYEPGAESADPAPSSNGSGFVVDRNGTILTNSHVVTPGGMSVERVRVIVLDHAGVERNVEGSVVGMDASRDVAIVRIDPRGLDLSKLPLGAASDLAVGDRVYVIGNPLDFNFSMTSGIVSALHRMVLGPNNAVIGEAIQTDAAVNHGDSGGPLLDAAGHVVGINEQIATEETGGSGNIGLAFAVPIESAVDVLRQLSATGQVRHAWLGIEGLSITPELVSLLKLRVDTGVLLVAVAPGGPADRAGLRGGDHPVRIPGRVIYEGGDVVTSINGRAVTGMTDVVNFMLHKRPGSIVAVSYQRDQAVGTTHIALGVQPSQP